MRTAIGLGWIAIVAGLLALGTWQVERRAWKLDLIARVDARIHAAPVAAPRTIAGKDDAYRRVRAAGAYLPNADVLVQAATVRGAGWWVITPLRTDRGLILVNRGFVPSRAIPAPPIAPVVVTGLLRLSEPGGGFLRSNDAARDRWFSRDVAAIAAARRLGAVAPYFIDADDSANRPGAPVGGLTVIAFPNNHLVYAITWYVLAAMAIFGFLYWRRLEAAS